MVSKAHSVIAAFDFDGTITDSDSFLPFVLFAAGGVKTVLGVLWKSPVFVRYVLGKANRQQVKEAIIEHFFGDWPKERFEAVAREYAEGRLEELVRSKALARVAWHLERGDRCVIVSASLTSYLEPWAKKHGFHDVISSKVAYDERGRLTGRLEGANCRAEEKVRRLKEAFGDKEGYTLYAYGDSEGDEAMLAFCDYPHYRTFAS